MSLTLTAVNESIPFSHPTQKLIKVKIRFLLVTLCEVKWSDGVHDVLEYAEEVYKLVSNDN